MMLRITILIALGIFFYLPADIIPLAGEEAMKAVSDKSHINFNKVKIEFDIITNFFGTKRDMLLQRDA